MMWPGGKGVREGRVAVQEQRSNVGLISGGNEEWRGSVSFGQSEVCV